MQSLHQLAGALALAFLAAAPAGAANLVYTGTPNGTGSTGVVDATDHLALQFTAQGAWQIDGVAAFLNGGNPGDQFALTLYTAGAGIAGLPDTALATVNVNFLADGWNGAAGLGWTLPSAGTYWLAVEGLTAATDPFGPLGNFAAPTGGLVLPGPGAFDAGSGYALSNQGYGLQITGAVAEPGSLPLLLAGLGALGWRAWSLRR